MQTVDNVELFPSYLAQFDLPYQRAVIFVGASSSQAGNGSLCRAAGGAK